MHTYHDARKTLPPGDAGTYFGTWFPLIMPYIERTEVGNLYVQWGKSSGSESGYYGAGTNFTFSCTRLAEFTCPSDQTSKYSVVFARHNYVVNYGNTAIDNVNFTSGPSNGGRRPTASLNGVTHGGAPFAPVDVDKGINGGVSFSKITDGLSDTLMLSETIQAKETAAQIDVRGLVFWGDAALFVAYSAPIRLTPISTGLRVLAILPSAIPPAAASRPAIPAGSMPAAGTAAASRPRCATARCGSSKTESS